MKKISKLLVLLVTIFSFNLKVNAATTLSVSSNNVQVGDTFKVYVNMYSMAAWNIHVTSDGPVSGCTINEADSTNDANNTSKTFSSTCVATGEGTITLTMSGDTTSADGNNTSLSGTQVVTVTKKVNNTNTNTNNNTNTVTKSTNNKLKELKVDSYEVTKVDDNNYTLKVSASVSSINVTALAEDDKATVTGSGEHKLITGDNTIDIVIKAESGAENTIKLLVTKNDGYELDDLANLLTNSSEKTIKIKINNDTTITDVLMKQIKVSGKKVILNYYDNLKIIYSYVIDGSKLKSTNSLKTTISTTSDNSSKIDNISNYADGVKLNFIQKLEIPSGVTVKYYVGDKYNNSERLNVYYYSDDSLVLINNNVEVKDGYIEFDFTKGYDYFITKAVIGSSEEVKEASNLPIIIIIVLVLVIGCLLFFVIKKKKNNKDVKEEVTNTNLDNNVVQVPVNNVSTTEIPNNNVMVNNTVSNTVVSPVTTNSVSTSPSVVTNNCVNNQTTTSVNNTVNSTQTKEVKLNLKQSTNPNINPNLGVKPVFKQND